MTFYTSRLCQEQVLLYLWVWTKANFTHTLTLIRNVLSFWEAYLQVWKMRRHVVVGLSQTSGKNLVSSIEWACLLMPVSITVCWVFLFHYFCTAFDRFMPEYLKLKCTVWVKQWLDLLSQGHLMHLTSQSGRPADYFRAENERPGRDEW